VLLAQLEASRTLRTLAAIEFEPFVHKPLLWKARLLHFRGHRGHTVDASRGNIQTDVDDHRDAGRLYTHNQVRPPDSSIAAQEADDVRRAWTTAKRNATFWLGLLSYDRRDYQVASNWLQKAQADELWRPGAVYNLARCAEAQADLDRAIERLRSDLDSPPPGYLIRAQLLEDEFIGTPPQ